MGVFEIMSLQKRAAVLLTLVCGFCADAQGQTNLVLHFDAVNFTMLTTNLICDNALRPIPFSQSAVKQSTVPASFGPNPKIPYFTVRFAMPVPPSNATNEVAALTGIDPMVF